MQERKEIAQLADQYKQEELVRKELFVKRTEELVKVTATVIAIDVLNLSKCQVGLILEVVGFTEFSSIQFLLVNTRS